MLVVCLYVCRSLTCCIIMCCALLNITSGLCGDATRSRIPDRKLVLVCISPFWHSLELYWKYQQTHELRLLCSLHFACSTQYKWHESLLGPGFVFARPDSTTYTIVYILTCVTANSQQTPSLLLRHRKAYAFMRTQTKLRPGQGRAKLSLAAAYVGRTPRGRLRRQQQKPTQRNDAAIMTHTHTRYAKRSTLQTWPNYSKCWHLAHIDNEIGVCWCDVHVSDLGCENIRLCFLCAKITFRLSVNQQANKGYDNHNY